VNICLPGVAAVVIQELFTRNTVVRFRNSLLPLFSQHSLRENTSDWLPKFRGVINELLVTDALCCDWIRWLVGWGSRENKALRIL